MAILTLGAEIEVVRIPELPAADLADDDAVPIWHASNNVTSKVTLSDLRTFIETGSGGTLDEILSGGSILYIVASGEVGDDTYVNTALAGLSFKLTRDGYPLKIGVEYEVLAAGGFRLLGTTFIEGQRYELDVFALTNGVISPPSGVTDGFISGNDTVNTNINIAAAGMGKVYQIRGAATALTITLPDVDVVANNAFVVFEALINNTKQHRIQTSSGQLIYINNEAVTFLYISKGEYLWLYRTADGWFVISDKGNFTNLCIPKPAYKVGLNQVALDGSVLVRADYPRLWNYVQTLGASLVSEATWQTVSATVASRLVAFPYRGCFSTGNGSTTFRLPDYRGSTVRGLVNPGGADSQRAFNNPGGFQLNEILDHFHSLPDNILINGSAGGGEDGTNNHTNISPATGTGSEGGTESRMDNIGINWIIDY